jgi:hypothetical protein
MVKRILKRLVWFIYLQGQPRPTLRSLFVRIADGSPKLKSRLTAFIIAKKNAQRLLAEDLGPAITPRAREIYRALKDVIEYKRMEGAAGNKRLTDEETIDAHRPGSSE